MQLEVIEKGGSIYFISSFWLQPSSCQSTGVIKVEGGHTDQFPFEKGVRQGCIMSPLLFNDCGDDDTTLLAHSKTEANI